MKVLVFTNMYPFPAMPFYGSFVRDEVEALRDAGVDADVYFVNGRANRLNYAGAPFGLAKRLRSRRYDVIHVHHSFCAFFATVQRRIPVVWTFHEGEIDSTADVVRADSPVKRLAYSSEFKRSMARRVDRLITVSEHLKDPLGRDDAVTIPCGIDTGVFKPMDRSQARSRLGLDPGGRYALFPSSPDRVEKRFDLARAGAEAFADRTGTKLELLCLDNVPHEDVPGHMNACDVFLMTSAFEASPVTVREALACNLPVVSTDVGDVRTVLDGIAGCYIIEPSPADIAQGVEAVLESAEGFNGRDKMEDYSLETTVKKLLALYAGLVEDRGTR